jgi:hypothetical protein
MPPPTAENPSLRANCAHCGLTVNNSPQPLDEIPEKFNRQNNPIAKERFGFQTPGQIQEQFPKSFAFYLYILTPSRNQS